MAPIILQDNLRIPSGIDNLEAFRQWARSDNFPKRGRYSFIRGEVWVDLSMEQGFTHNRVKTRFAIVLDPLVEAEGLGYYFSDGMSVTNQAAGLSTVPDGVFVSFDSIRDELVRLEAGSQGGCTELAGSPDMTLEVVSEHSVCKDTVELRELYWKAGIGEFWLVDARSEPPLFEILRRGSKGYVATRPQGGWIKSKVFGRSFRLTHKTDALGHPQYVLESKT